MPKRAVETAANAPAAQLPRDIPVLDALTGARFLAAFWVFNCHFLYLDLWFAHVPPWIIYARNAGDSGVTYFFLLSAFMMTIAYPRPLLTGQQRKAFWIARFARLYPLYFLCFLWFAPFALTHWFLTMTPMHAARHAAFSAANTLLLVQDWFSPFQALLWNGPGWTLSVDVLFYLAFPWLAAWMCRRSRKFLLAWIAAIWILCVVMAAGAQLRFPHSILVAGLVARHPLFLSPVLLMGMALGYLFQMHLRTETARNSSFPTWLTLAGLAGIVAMSLGVGNVDRWLPHVYFYLPAIAAVLYGLALGGWPAPLLRVRPLLVLGDSVYAFYLTQIPLGCTLVWLAGGLHLRDVLDPRTPPHFTQTPLFYVTVLACALVLSVVLFRYFETPWRIRLRRSLGERWLHRPLPPPIIPGQGTAANSGQAA